MNKFYQFFILVLFSCIGTAIVAQPAIRLDSIRQIRCAGASTGAIFITATGSTPFTYAWSSGEATDDISGKPIGSYTVTVTDRFGSRSNATYNIISPDPILVGVDSVINNRCNGESQGKIYISAVGGELTYPKIVTCGDGVATPTCPMGAITGDVAGPYSTYTSIGPFYGYYESWKYEAIYTAAELRAAGFKPGKISSVAFNVYLKGTTRPYQNFKIWLGCTSENTHSGLFNSATTPNVTLASYSTVLGWNTFNLTTPFNWDGVSNIYIQTCHENTSTGTYPALGGYDYVGVGPYSPTPYCAYNYAFGGSSICATIAGYTYVYRAMAQMVNCPASPDTLRDYRYRWSSGDTTQDITRGLAAGVYNVTISDANNCSVTHSGVTVTEPTAITYAIDTVIGLNCDSVRSGAISLTATGGVTPYTYAWRDGGSTSDDRTGLARGAYYLSITDDNGCVKVTNPIYVNVTNPVNLDFDSVSVIRCFGDRDGYIDLDPTGGTAPYRYNWAAPVTSTTDIATGLAAGAYAVTVYDNLNCGFANIVNIPGPTAAVSVTVDGSTNPTCVDSRDGSIRTTPNGGWAPYNYTWSPVAPNDDDVSGLPNGTYTATVTDIYGCSTVMSSVMLNGTGVAPNIELGPDTVICNNGTIGVSTSPGTTLLWSNGASSSSISVATSGNYWVRASNACGTDVDATNVSIIRSPSSGFGYWNYGTTAHFDDLSFTSPGSTYSWNFGDGNTSTLTDPVHVYATGGKYTVTLTVTNKCGTSTYTDTVNVVPLSIGDVLADTRFVIYPNPTAQDLNIELNAADAKNINIEIMNVMGSKIFDKQVTVQGELKETVNLSHVASGTYFIRLSHGENVIVKKLQVTK